MSAIFTMQVTVEPKEDVTIEGVAPHVPSGSEVAGALFDQVADWTKHEAQLGWRVTTMTVSQEPVPEGPPPPSSRAGGGYLVDIEED